jgi:hypothetical protein
MANWEQTASYASCTDLSSVFYVRWGFPRPDGSVTPRPPADAVPEPSGSCAPPGPQRGDYKNAAQFCKAERAFLGDIAFAKKYGTNGNGANAYGKCVSQNR